MFYKFFIFFNCKSYYLLVFFLKGPCLIQIARPDSVLLFQFVYNEKVTKITKESKLAKYLLNSRILKTGVAIENNKKSFFKVTSINIEGLVELKMEGQDLKDFNDLVYRFLNIKIDKKNLGSLKYKNWNKDLDCHQINYAAGDAWMSLIVYNMKTHVEHYQLSLSEQFFSSWRDFYNKVCKFF